MSPNGLQDRSGLLQRVLCFRSLAILVVIMLRLIIKKLKKTDRSRFPKVTLLTQIHLEKLQSRIFNQSEYDPTNQHPVRRKRRRYSQVLTVTKTGSYC